MSLLQDPIFSPFSPTSIQEEHNRSLLLQFLLNEVLEISAFKQTHGMNEKLSSTKIWYLPYDWAVDRGPLNKALEYASLLPSAFPKKHRAASTILKKLNKIASGLDHTTPLSQPFKEVYRLIENFFAECEEDENLLFFLLKNKTRIDSLMRTGYLRAYLLKLYPKGLRSLEEMVSDEYHKRGFFSLIPELKELIQALDND